MEKVIISNEIFFGEVLRMLRDGHNVTIPVKGVSMLPFIRGDRDAVVLEPADRTRNLAPGDIVLFRYDGRFILHRILKINADVAEIRGDGAVSKEHCHLCDIYGRAVRILRKGAVPVDPYSCSSRMKVWLWLHLPLRRYVLAIYRRLYGLHA